MRRRTSTTATTAAVVDMMTCDAVHKVAARIVQGDEGETWILARVASYHASRGRCVANSHARSRPVR